MAGGAELLSGESGLSWRTRRLDCVRVMGLEVSSLLGSRRLQMCQHLAAELWDQAAVQMTWYAQQ